MLMLRLGLTDWDIKKGVHGGWPAHAVSDMIDGLKGARIENENEIQFDSTGGDELVTEQAEIDEWIGNLA